MSCRTASFAAVTRVRLECSGSVDGHCAADRALCIIVVSVRMRHHQVTGDYSASHPSGACQRTKLPPTKPRRNARLAP